MLVQEGVRGCRRRGMQAEMSVDEVCGYSERGIRVYGRDMWM